VAQAYSEDPETAAKGGDYPGWIGESNDILAETQLHPFHEAVLNLQPNEISRPFAFGDSLYIVEVVERTAPQPLTFEQAKPYLQEILNQQKHEERLVELSGQLFKQANVIVYQAVLDGYLKQVGVETPAPGP
jgi:parvulin-like peptidyl-prolyl isomerase